MSMVGRIGWAGSLGLALLAGGATGHAQFLQKPTVPQAMLNNPALKPPAGAKVALVEFDDMQCPLCGAWNPILMQAAAKYHVAWVRHDFLIPGHPLSPQEAVNARWFDSKSPKLGAAYRDTVFAQQRNIATRDDLQSCTEQFAKQHGLALPFAMDPQGKLMDAVRADCHLGMNLGVQHTPTLWVVTQGSHDAGYSFVEVSDVNLLYAYLDQAESATANKTSQRRRQS